ncbi:hypothetical protein JHK82_018712 [Glycine max]|nr:hypothetical protein JHK85_019154 [Glycine max]KAG5143017.1 hypothetical protein JHK82_018712 [Glycine max]
MHSLRELAQNRTIVPLEYFLEKVVWSEAQLPLVRPNEVAPPEPAPAQLEVVPPSPPLIIISDASSDETVAPLDSPAEETADPPASPVGGIADLFDSSSGEVVALTDFPV